MAKKAGETIFCYDFNLCQRYINGGATPTSMGVGIKGDPFMTFIVTDNLSDIFSEWNGTIKSHKDMTLSLKVV